MEPIIEKILAGNATQDEILYCDFAPIDEKTTMADLNLHQGEVWNWRITSGRILLPKDVAEAKRQILEMDFELKEEIHNFLPHIQQRLKHWWTYIRSLF